MICCRQACRRRSRPSRSCPGEQLTPPLARAADGVPSRPMPSPIQRSRCHGSRTVAVKFRSSGEVRPQSRPAPDVRSASISGMATGGFVRRACWLRTAPGQAPCGRPIASGNGDFLEAIQRGAQRAVSAALQRLLGRLRRSRGAAWPVTGPILIDGWTRGRKARSVGQFTTQDLVLTDICIDSYGIPESRMPSTC